MLQSKSHLLLRPPKNPSRRAAGLSIVEVLVVIGVVGLLIGISAPGIAVARARSREIGCGANLRGVAQIVAIYTQSYKDNFPFSPAGAVLRAAPDDDSLMLLTNDHWSLQANWPSLMHTSVNWREAYASWVCVGADRLAGAPWKRAKSDGLDGASYWYSSAFVARPAVWSDPIRPLPSKSELLQAVSVSDVVFPSAKVEFVDVELAHAGSIDPGFRRPVVFADGHVSVERIDRSLNVAVNRLTGRTYPLFDTADGARGRDY